MKFSDLLSALEAIAPPIGSDLASDPEVTGVAAIDAATPGSLSYIEGAKFATQVGTTHASALILPANETLQHLATARGIAWVATTDPRLLFAAAIAQFYQPFRPAPAIHPTAVIDPSVQLGDRVAIGAHVVIQPRVTIGNDVCIHPNVVIYPGVVVGDRTTLHANCVIHERSQIGSDCVIHSGAAIGSEGFGFVPTQEGWFKMEQSGYTVLETGVEVGCNATIDRPAVGETRIRRQTKLDNLVHIAHGCEVGEGCAMAAQVGLAGGVRLGNRVFLGGQVGISNQVQVGDGTQAAAQTGITSDLAPGSVVMGTPAVPFRQFWKTAALWSRLPEMYQTLKQLQRHPDEHS